MTSTRRRRDRFFLVLAALLIASPAMAVRSLSAGEARCSKPIFPGSTPSIFFTGNATADVRQAGVTGAIGLRNRTFEGTVDGQRFEVSRIGGFDAARLPPGTTSVIVVAWEYSQMCSPEKLRTSPWVPPGTRGLVWGDLRAEEHWVDGIPTLDVHNSYQLPYPRAYMRGGTADDAFMVISLMPAEPASSLEALESLLSWIRQRPQPLAGDLNSLLLSLLHRHITREVIAMRPAPAGTYRMELDLGDGVERTFFARTAAHPERVGDSERGTDWQREGRKPEAYTYFINAVSAVSRTLLPAAQPAQEHGFFRVSLKGDLLADGSTSWNAAVSRALLAQVFGREGAVARVTNPAPHQMLEFLQLNASLPAADGRFIVHPDGRATFEQRFILPGGGTATVRGERIAMETLGPPQ
jgi:hypothetical protein